MAAEHPGPGPCCMQPRVGVDTASPSPPGTGSPCGVQAPTRARTPCSATPGTEFPVPRPTGLGQCQRQRKWAELGCDRGVLGTQLVPESPGLFIPSQGEPWRVVWPSVTCLSHVALGVCVRVRFISEMSEVKLLSANGRHVGVMIFSSV